MEKVTLYAIITDMDDTEMGKFCPIFKIEGATPRIFDELKEFHYYNLWNLLDENNIVIDKDLKDKVVKVEVYYDNGLDPDRFEIEVIGDVGEVLNAKK